MQRRPRRRVHRRPRRSADRLYVLVDDLLPARRRSGRPPRISDSELICLAVAQVLLDCPNERRFLRFAGRRLGHLFPYIPGQSGFNKRLRALAPQLVGSGHAAGPALAVVLRPAAAARLDPGAVRGLARDGRAAPRWPDSAATATAARTAATSGASASTCSAPPTGCRSASSSPPPTRPSGSSPQNCSNAPCSQARP